MRSGRRGVRHLMAVVAVSALALAALREVWSIVGAFIDSPEGLGLASQLMLPGQAAVVRDEFHAAAASKVFWINPSGTRGHNGVCYDYYPAQPYPTGEYLIAAGTPCVVTIETALDEDDCSDGDRLMGIKILGGPNQGIEVAIPRRLLRKR